MIMLIQRFFCVVFFVVLLQSLGCSHSGSSHLVVSANEQSVADSKETFPKDIEGVGLVFDPISNGKTAVEVWASNRSKTYGATVHSVHVTEHFYYVVMRGEGRWLIDSEHRQSHPYLVVDGMSFGLCLSPTFWTMKQASKEGDSGGEGGLFFGEGGLFAEGAQSDIQYVQTHFDEDWDSWEAAKGLPRYKTERQDADGDLFYYSDVPPLVITDHQVGQNGLLVRYERVYSRMYAADEDMSGPIQHGEGKLECFFWLPAE